MPTKHRDPRLIAVELRSQQFGYAVFDGPKQLLDYGGGQLRPGGQAGSVIAARRIRKLIRLFTPSAIVVKRPDPHVENGYPGIRLMTDAILHEASSHLIPHRLIGRAEVQRAFRIFRARNKYEIGMVLAWIFPELLSRLPGKRKLGDPEHPRMVVFDAIALGFAYWQQSGTQIPLPD